MPNISMIEKVVQLVRAVDYLVRNYTFLLINHFVSRQNFLTDEDISWMWLLSSTEQMGNVQKSVRTFLFRVVQRVFKLVR